MAYQQLHKKPPILDLSKKFNLKLGLCAMSVAALTSCQIPSAFKTIKPTTPIPKPADYIHQLDGEVTVACEGTYHCELTKIDNEFLISPLTHRPLPEVDVVAPEQLLKKKERTLKTVKLVPLLRSDLSGLITYYARVIPGPREVHVNFYPEPNDNYIENFALIHHFKEPGDYRLHAYRRQLKKKNASLLVTASPDPLCVKLIKNGKTLRDFCKIPGDSRQNEFSEVTDFPDAQLNSLLIKNKNAQ